MTDLNETYLKGNEDLALFLGGKIRPSWTNSKGISVNYWETDNENDIEIIRKYRKLHKLADIGNFPTQGILTDNLNFHCDYNCLIPIVEKIESIYDKFHGHFVVYIHSNNCSIQGSNLKTNSEDFHPAYFSESTCETKLQSIWEQCVLFARWYKENLKIKNNDN